LRAWAGWLPAIGVFAAVNAQRVPWWRPATYSYGYRGGVGQCVVILLAYALAVPTA